MEPSPIWDHLHRTCADAPLIRHSRHSAALTYKGRIVCEGVASYKTHPIMRRFNRDNDRKVCLHAELDVITRAIRKFGVGFLKECDLYVFRLTKGGNVGLSKPCDGCQRAIDAFGIPRVYWST